MFIDRDRMKFQRRSEGRKWYWMIGRDSDAEMQYSAVERWSQQTSLHSALYNRHLVLFLADHDLNTALAYKLASKEYETRRDIYGADALAWAALKAGKLNVAQTVIKTLCVWERRTLDFFITLE